MTEATAGLKAECTFFYLSKFEGDPAPKPAEISEYDALRQDLLNPQCVEMIVGGEGLPTQVWRKQCP